MVSYALVPSRNIRQVLLMYLQKNINIIMNVETDLLGSVLVNHAEDFFFLHEYAILPASRCDEYSDHL